MVLYSLMSYSSTRPILPGATVAEEFHMSVQGVFPQVLQGGDRPQNTPGNWGWLAGESLWRHPQLDT